MGATIERGSQGGWEIGLQQNQTTAPENLKSAAKKRTFSCVLRCCRFLGMGLKKSQPERQFLEYVNMFKMGVYNFVTSIANEANDAASTHFHRRNPPITT